MDSNVASRPPDKGKSDSASGAKVISASTLQFSSPTAGATKSDRMQPIFRLVEAYDKRKQYSSAAIKRSSKTADEYEVSLEERRKKGYLYAEESEPVWHKISNTMVTPPIIAENLSLHFRGLPLKGAPEDPTKLEEYEDAMIRKYVGFDLDDTEYEELKSCCNPDNLRTGNEVLMSTSYPTQGLISKNLVRDSDESNSDEEQTEERSTNEPELWTLKRLKKRQKKEEKNNFAKYLKYRGVKQFPLREQSLEDANNKDPPELEPGKDVLYRIRVYRPFNFQANPNNGDKNIRVRHSVFSCDMVVTSRTALTALRDRFSCRNDLDMRLDMSRDPDAPHTASAKTIFPSGFLFINNTFYVDSRTGCHDTSATIRRWAQQRGLGAFPVRNMKGLCVGDILVRLAHPEVYVHQGSCEHLFVFSEMRLVARADPLRLAAYPCHTQTSQNQSIYCTTCAEFSAKWLVTGSDRVPFDPAFFCDTCFKGYLYKDGQKIGDFKAYAYKGNELNVKNIVSNYTMILDYN